MFKHSFTPPLRGVLNQAFKLPENYSGKSAGHNLKLICHSSFISRRNFILNKKEFVSTVRNLLPTVGITSSYRTVGNLQTICNLQTIRNLHTTTNYKAKLFVDRENVHAYKILQSIPISVEGEYNTYVACEVDSESQLNDLLEQSWRNSSASEIVDAFKNALNYSILNNIPLSDQRFDNLVDGLMDQVEYLTDEELSELLLTVSRYPPCESIKSHNFHDIWSCLDDICCWRMANWSTDTVLFFADHWYKLNLGKVSDFIYEVIEKFSRRPDKLTKDQLVHIFFYINICRKRFMDFAYESALDAEIENMTADEMAVCAMGFFKSQSKVKISRILEVMMRKIKEDVGKIHEMSLCALLKVIRFSNHVSLADQMYELLQHLLPEIDRFSNLACIHISLLGTNVQVCHKELLEKIACKILKDVNKPTMVRLKDLERLLLSLTMFNIHPKTEPDIYEAIYRELHTDDRLKEILQYPRCLPSALCYLAMRNMYSHQLMNTVLDQDFIVDNFGKPAKLLPRELFTLDKCIELECPNYSGNRLDVKTRYRAAKWLAEYTPTYDQHKKLSAAEKLILDVIDHVKQMTGGSRFVQTHHVLPHFPRADIILCKSFKSNQFVEPVGYENYVLGDIMYPYNTKDFSWYALVIVGWNNTIRNSVQSLGLMSFKTRHLKLVGYKPVMIIWNEYMRLPRTEKIKYISSKIDAA